MSIRIDTRLANDGSTEYRAIVRGFAGPWQSSKEMANADGRAMLRELREDDRAKRA